ERLKAAPRSSAAQAGGQVVWALRPRSALPDLVATLEDASRPAADRLIAAETLGAMEWPDAMRAIEAAILAPSTTPAVRERALAIYSRQLFSLWPDAQSSPALPAIVRTGLS